MSDNGYGGYDPYANPDQWAVPYPNAPLYGGNLGFSGAPDASLPYPNAPSYGTGSMGGDYGYLDPSNNYAYSDASGGGTRDFWDRAGDWLAKPGVQRGFAELGGLGQGLLQGSGPSLQPRNFYSALGQGMAGATTAGTAYDESLLRQAQTGKLNIEAANTNLWNQALSGEAQRATGLPPGYGAAGAGPSGVPVQTQPLNNYAAPASSAGGQGGWGSYAQPAIGALTSAGVSSAGQQAIMAHGLAEGGFNTPWNVGDNGNSFGHWQFNKGGELPGYTAWAQGKGDLQDTGLQAQYVAKRMEDLYPGFSKIQDPAEAMRKVAAFERYTGWQQNPRLGFLADAQKAMGGGAVQPRISLSDTAYQMPSNMAAGLGEPPAAGGILPQAPPPPGITQPPGLATGLRPPVATLSSGAPVGPAPLIATAPAAAEPSATTGTSAPAAARVAAAGAPNLVEGDSIAYGLQKFGGLPGNPKGGRNPQQVLDNINSNLKSDPDYYRGKTVILSPGVMNGPNQIGIVPDQIQRIQNAGGKVILAGVDTGKFAGHNGTLAQMATAAGVPFAGPLPTNDVHPGPDGYRQYLARVQRGAAQASDAGGGGGGSGGAEIAPVPANPEPLASGAVPGAVPGIVAPPAVAPAATVPPPAAAGPLATGGALQLPPGAPAAPADAGPVLTRGTAQGMPQPPPAPPPAATAAPPGVPPVMPGAVAGGPPAMPGAIPAATAGARPPVPMPAVITGQPPSLPNLPQPGSAGVPGMPAYDVEAARRAQVLGLAASATGHTLPDYLKGQADLPNKAVAQQWEMQKTLYGAQLKAVSDQWSAANDMQKEAIAAQNGLSKAGYESTLRTQENEWDKGRMIGPDGRVILRPGFTEAEAGKAGTVKGAELGAQLPYDVLKDYNTIRPMNYVPQTGPQAGVPMTRNVSQATLDAEEGRPPPPAVAAAMGRTPPAGGPAPAPGGTVLPSSPGYATGLAPGRSQELEAEGTRLTTMAGTIHTDAAQARAAQSDLDYLSALGPSISKPGPFAAATQAFNRVRQSVLGDRSEPVSSYETAEQLMGGMLRKALKASDSNSTEKQQVMMQSTFPTPASSAQGFQQGIKYMQGVADWQQFHEKALINWKATHQNSAQGFEDSYNLSAIPFVVLRMDQPSRDQYLSAIQKADPSGATARRLADQMEAVKNRKYTYNF